MVSINVKVLNKDNRFGGRNVDISFGSSSFKTPYRTATHRDYHSASSLPHKVIIENPVSEYVSTFNNTSFDAFLSGNGSLARRKKLIDQSIDMMRYSPIMSTIQIPTQEKVTQDQLMLFDLFQNRHLSIISMPPFEYKDIKEYEKVITQFSETARSRKQEAMPILPLSTELSTFKLEFAALRRLHDTGICNVIGFAYANPDTHSHQYLEIYSNREENIWYHTFGVPKVPRGKKSISVAHIHELQNWGLDTFSPEVRDIPHKAISYLIMNSKASEPDEIELKRYDSPTLGVFKEPEWIERYGHDLHCNCPVCKGKDLTSFKDEFMHELNGSFNPSLLHSADKIHELISGTEEFGESMKAIKSDDLPTYYKSKEFTKGRIKPPI